LANSYGFLFHPYLTLKRVSHDRSQLAIFALLWLGGWLGVLLLGILAFLICLFFPQFVLLKKASLGLGFLGAIFLSFFTFYLLYWNQKWKQS